MKILFIVYSDISLDAGHTTHVRELTQNLEKLGNSVTLIARTGSVNGIKVTRLYGGWIIKGNSLFRRGVNFLISLLLFFFRILLNTRHADVVYVRDAKSGFMAIIPKIIFKKKMIFEVNGLIAMEHGMSIQSAWNKLLMKILHFMEFATVKNSDKIIPVTKNLSETFIDEYSVKKEKMEVISNGVNIDLFHPMSNIKLEDVKQKFGIRDRYIISFIGIIAPWHGVEYLVESAPYVLKEVPSTRFLIVGDGVMRKKLENMVEESGLKDKFMFTGRVPYETISRYINVSDVCVAPFIMERNLRIGLSPLKIYEYAACGKSIVASRIPNLEFIEEQKAGTLVDPENPLELAKAILKLLKDEKLRAEMGGNGKDYVVKNHSWEKVAERVGNVCKSVV